MSIEVKTIKGKKRKALERFIQRLLGSPMGNKVARIFLFGSLKKGEAQPESDIDVLVFAFNSFEALREACAKAAFETAMETGEGIEPLVYPLTMYFNPNTYS